MSSRLWHFAVAGRCLLGLLLLLPWLASCNELKDWRDSQIRQSHSAASAGKLIAPAQPISIPASITKELPWDPGFVVVTFHESREGVAITALSPWDTLQTSKWMLTRLWHLGYDSGDNPSRILEGVEYASQAAKFPKLFVKVTMNTHEQCIVEYSGSS